MRVLGHCVKSIWWAVLAPVAFAPGVMLVSMLHGKKDVAVVVKVTNQQTSLVAQMVKRLSTMWETQV